MGVIFSNNHFILKLETDAVAVIVEVPYLCTFDALVLDAVNLPSLHFTVTVVELLVLPNAVSVAVNVKVKVKSDCIPETLTNKPLFGALKRLTFLGYILILIYILM